MKIKREYWQRLLRFGPCIYEAGAQLEPPNWTGYLLRGGDAETAATWQARGERNEKKMRGMQ